MQQIGYSLVDQVGTEVSAWGTTMGQCQKCPDFVRLPSGDDVHGITGPCVLQSWRLVPRVGCYGAVEETSFDGTQTIATFVVSEDLVIKERERRLALGFSFDFGDQRGVHQIGTTEQDMKGWDEVKGLAFAAVLLGQTATPINVVTNTGPVTVTALEWLQILIAAGQFRQPIWAASFRLQGMSPIPADYDADGRWQ